MESDDVLTGLSMAQFNQFGLSYDDFVEKTNTTFAIRQIFVKFPFQLFETNEEEKMNTFLSECADS